MKHIFVFLLTFLFFFSWKESSFATQIPQREESLFSQIVFQVNEALYTVNEKTAKGERIITDFGYLQLFGAESGTQQNTGLLHFVLKVQLKANYLLKEPILQISSADNIKLKDVFYPFSQKNEAELCYKGLVYFPFSMQVDDPLKSIRFEMSFSGLVCQQESCLPYQVSLPSYQLPNTVDYSTYYTGFIMRQFAQAPALLEDKAITLHQEPSSSHLWIQLQLPEKIGKDRRFFLFDAQNKAVPFSVIESQVENKEGFFVLDLSHIPDKIMLIIQNENHHFVYFTGITLQKKPLVSLVKEEKRIPLFLMVLFVFISPVLVCLLSLNFKNEIGIRSKLLTSLIGVFCGILCGCVIYTIYPYQLLLKSPVWLCFCALLWGFLFLFPIQMTSFAYGLLTALLPYFIFPSVAEYASDFKHLFFFFTQLALVNSIPYFILLRKTFWAVQLKKIASVKKYVFISGIVLFTLLLIDCF